MTALSHDRRAPARESHLATAATAVLLVLGLGIAWTSTVGQARTMASMVQGLAQVGRASPFDMSAPGFLAMWATMMAAMMVVAVAPLVLVYGRWRAPLAATSSRAVFVAGYVAIWTLAGLLVLVALRAMSGAHATAWLDRLGGAVLLAAGAYQFAPSKQRAIAAYRQALTDPARSMGRGPVAAAREGFRQGGCCLVCCGALMAVLLAVGVMNVAWMAVLTVVCFGERNWRHGAGVTAATGIVLLSLGLAVLLHPQLLTALAPGPTAMAPMR